MDLAAPAVPIYNIAPGALYDPPYISTWGGTSFSSAIVSGVAGLVWSANMSMNNWQLDQILRNTADNIGDPLFFGAGRINANAAVIQAPNPPPLPTPTPSPTPVPTQNPNELFLGNIGGVGVNIGKGKAQASVSNTEPGSVILLMYDFTTEGEPYVIPSGVCEGETLHLPNPTKFERARADENGNATFSFRISSNMQGKTVFTQAYTLSKGTVCKKSRTRQKTIPIP